ncbi:hypothetical protein CAQ69_23975 [Stutzerimonas stutzeri]|nr:hypothetical protein CAQ69_23975 [Stutzerimonas stutzeri]
MFSCSKIEQKQLNTWVSFQSAEQPLLGQFSVSSNTLGMGSFEVQPPASPRHPAIRDIQLGYQPAGN